MLKRLLVCLWLVGCGVSEKNESQEVRQTPPSRHVYMLMPKPALLEEEYRILLRQALWTQLEDPDFQIHDSELRQEALLNTASRIAWTLDSRYGDQVTGELLPNMRVLIVESCVDIDLGTLEGLIDD